MGRHVKGSRAWRAGAGCADADPAPAFAAAFLTVSRIRLAEDNLLRLHI
jgi:hypothetical protein